MIKLVNLPFVWSIPFRVSLEASKTGTAIKRALHPVREDRNLLLFHLHRKMIKVFQKGYYHLRSKSR
ncbi:unnamed protein product [Larinioides sclopetarius]|uniref:Uncharacterized protein n=1 Tax=Larinioides sclopetarius TaxID=280406 RepID=A0AAV2ADL3_9ARAC